MIAIGWICFGYVEECVQPPQFGGGSSWWWGMMGVHTPDLRTGLLERETHQESMEWSRMEPWLSVALPLPPSSLNSSRYVLKIFKIVQSLNVFFYLSIFCDQPFECTGTPLAFPSFPVQRAASDTVSSRILRCSTCCKWDSAPKVRVLVLHGASMCFINVLITYCSCNLWDILRCYLTIWPAAWL